jgi:hypothetical protein
VKQISSHFTITSHKEDGEKGQQLLSSSILEGISSSTRFILLSLSLRSLSFNVKSDKKIQTHMQTCDQREISFP